MKKIWVLIFLYHFFFSYSTHAIDERLWTIAQQLQTAQALVESQQEIISSDIEEINSMIYTIDSKIDYLSTQTTALQSQIDTIPRVLSGYVSTGGTIFRGTGFTTTTVSGGVRINITTPFSSPPFVVVVQAAGGPLGNPAEVGNVTASTFDVYAFNTSGFFGIYQHQVNTGRPVYFLAFGY